MYISRRLWRAGIGGLCVCLLLSLCGFAGNCAEVRNHVVRLHILANSDSDDDQALKLQVRDAIVEAAAGWLDNVPDATAAQAVIAERLPALEQIAQQTVTEAGYTYPVKAERTRMYFTTRQYDTVTMPAGMYEAVRFTIGDGEGQNWWCVVYPPLCAGAAIKPDPLADMLDPSQTNIITDGKRYIIRFKIVEWAGQIAQLFRQA